MDGWLAGWLAGWVGGWMDGWMDDTQGVSNAQHAPGEHVSLID